MSSKETGFYYDGVMAGREVRAGLSRRPAASRPLPMEEICFFVKPVDNSRLVRVLDPGSRWEWAKVGGAVAAVFVMALLYVLPYLFMLRAGYRIEDSKKQHQELVEAGRRLQVDQAALRDPVRIARQARALGMRPPTSAQVSYADASGASPADLVAGNLATGQAEASR